MIEGNRINRRSLLWLLLITGLVGALFVFALSFSGSFASAQGAVSTDEAQEQYDVEDSAEGPDMPITGAALEKAAAAALAYIGEGRVTGTEVGDEEGFYEIEITRSDGSQVDVHLDQAFNVLGHLDD